MRLKLQQINRERDAYIKERTEHEHSEKKEFQNQMQRLVDKDQEAVNKEKNDCLDKRKQTTQTAFFNLDYYKTQNSQKKQDRDAEK